MEYAKTKGGGTLSQLTGPLDIGPFNSVYKKGLCRFLKSHRESVWDDLTVAILAASYFMLSLDTGTKGDCVCQEGRCSL